MSDVATAIMDAAEARMRIGGFNGFSFRDIASDVGIKSSSVHYHFPTKENLAAAVIRRYTDEVAQLLKQKLTTGLDPVTAWTQAFRGTLHSKEHMCWTQAFRGTLHSKEHMCPCIAMGAAAQDLPAEVAAEVQRFFSMCLKEMVKAGLPRDGAARLLATISGAMLLANALDDRKAYDQATRDLIQEAELSAA